MAVTPKETIYVDIDDEITSIIDKVRKADGRIVALVLPKRATVLQSIVNMKLLKRTADDAKKNLVLVTSEASIMPLAGSVGLHVADSPTSKPTIPIAPTEPDDGTENVDEPYDMVGDEETDEEAGGFDPAAAAAVPVGELAAAKAPGKIGNNAIDEELNMDDEAEAGTAAAVVAKKPKKNKKLAVPNFDSFRKKLLLGAGILVLLIIAGVLAFVILPKATVTIKTDTSTITTNLNLTLDSAAKTLDPSTKTVPATVQTVQKSYSQQAAASGQQNNGSKAQGTVSMSAGSCSGNVPADIGAGTSLTTSAHTYTLNSGVSFVPTVSKGKCTFTGVDGNGNNSISIIALKGGADYNVSGASFSVSGRSDVSASGSASGGTDNITKVVAQSDIDSAKAKINAQDTTAVKQDLQAGLQGKSLQAVPATFVAGDPQITSSANAGDTGDSVTVTEIINYTMLGVKQADLKTLVDANVTSQLDKGKQSILDDGVAKAKLTLSSPATATSAPVALQAASIAGPQIDSNQLKTQLVGKKSGEIKALIKQTPGVTDVTVSYSPFWVSSTPKNPSKVTILIEKSDSGNQ